jgi:hypothetical protein
MYTANHIFFPHEAIITLKHLRGESWAALIAQICTLPETHEATLALMLLMVRLNGCMTCETDSFRAMKGCAACAGQTLRRFKGDDAELIMLYQQALRDVQKFAVDHPQLDILMPE